MKKVFLGIWLIGPMLIFAAFAHAQGCAQQPVTEFFSCEPCFSGDITSESCGPGGQPGWFCSEGHGVCCDVEYFTANVYPDEFDCGPTGPGGGGISHLKLQNLFPRRSPANRMSCNKASPAVPITPIETRLYLENALLFWIARL